MILQRVLRIVLLCGLLLMWCTACFTESYVPGEGYVPCVGLGKEQNPRLVYKLSAWNMVMAIVFLELIVPPIVVLADELFCPVAVKNTAIPQEGR